jgi:GT2 family glycosyltransferase
MMRKSTILEHGGYDERLDCICEDYDLWSRLAHKGVRFANLDEALIQYRVHSSATKSRRLRESLEDTLRIKKRYWADEFDLRARARFVAEKCLLLLPKRVVLALFQRLYVKSS